MPSEKFENMKSGKQHITDAKLYPGYVLVEMRLEAAGRIPQDFFFLIKETTGFDGFVGTAGRPTPMGPVEVERMLFDNRPTARAPQVKMEFAAGDAVTFREGSFQNYEGTVENTVPDKGIVCVLVTIFGRQAPVDVEYWQVAKAGEMRGIRPRPPYNACLARRGRGPSFSTAQSHRSDAAASGPSGTIDAPSSFPASGALMLFLGDCGRDEFESRCMQDECRAGHCLARSADKRTIVARIRPEQVIRS